MQVDMNVTLAQLIATSVVLLLALWGGAWALLSLNAKQFSQRMRDKFDETKAAIAAQKESTNSGITALRDQLTSHKSSIDAKMEALAQQTRTVERDLLTLKGDLPNHYERRDDAIRREMTIISRLDRINEKMRERDA